MKFFLIPVLAFACATIAQESVAVSSSVEYSKTGFTVIGTPESVTVSIDDSVRGTAPITVKGLTEGEHTIIWTKKGFYGKKQTVVAIKHSVLSISEELRAPASLTVFSSPDSALLFVNKKKVDKTPFTITPLRPETYSLMILKAGYNQFDTTVTLESGKSDTLKISLVAQGTAVMPLVIDSSNVVISPTTTPAKVELTDTEKSRRNLFTIIASALFTIFLTIVVVAEATDK